jgi:hypothetical protein
MSSRFRPSALILILSVLIASNLDAAWVADGVAVITVTGAQDTPAIVSDGAGGAIIVWRDYRTVNTDIYAQRVDADGNLLWIGTAMPVCNYNNAQSNPVLVSDGAGGAIVAWQDFRSNNVLDIYAQRINADGYGQWTGNGIPICTGKTGVALNKIIPDGSGGAIVAWHDMRNASNDIFAQRVDASGGVQWTANGVTVCGATGSQMYPTLVSDDAGGAIITWQDARSGTNDIYAQRLNASGTAQWAADGIVVCNATQYQTSPQIVADGSGGAIIAWTDHRNTIDYDVYAQRLDASGNPQWTGGGVIVSATTGNQMSCQLAPEGSGESIVLWIDYRSTTADVYAQRLNASGAPQWTANGVAVCTAADNQINVDVMPDGSGGALAIWQDARVSTTDYNVYAQKVRSNGTMAWAANGVAICTATGNQTTPRLAPDGWGGGFIAWKDERGSNADIYSQRVDAGGHTVVATRLQSYWSALTGDGIEVRWVLSAADEDISFVILRERMPADTYAEIPSAEIERDALSFSYVDRDCEPGATYRYRVDLCSGGERSVLFETEPTQAPAMRPILYQNIPNPFNPSTTIRYFIPVRSRVAVEIYDVRGNVIRRLFVGDRERGEHTAVWNGLNGDNNAVGSGVYYCRLKVGKETLSRKMILLR